MTKTEEITMFGCTVDELRIAFEGSSDRIGGPAMLVMSILSDSQELIATVAEGDSSGHTGERLELARQYINRAKYGLMEFLRNH